MKENTKLPLILILALPILLIVSTELSRISFTVFGQAIYINTLIFPLTLFVSVYITKTHESRTAMTMSILALIIECLVFVLKWVLLGVADYTLMEITFLAFFVSQLFILLGYESLKEMKKTKLYIKSYRVFSCVLTSFKVFFIKSIYITSF